MMIRASAALIGALLVGVVQAAQEPAPAPTIAAVRERVQAGQLDRAWALIQKVPETGETLREGITIALARRDISSAVAWYERLSRREPAGDAAALTTIVRVVADQLRNTVDPEIRILACAALAGFDDADCARELRDLAVSGADSGTRLSAAVAVAEIGLPGAPELLRRAAANAAATDPLANTAAFTHLNAATAVPILVQLLANERTDAQYVASYGLGHFATKEAKEALEGYLASDRAVEGRRVATLIALARLGDRQALAAVREGITRLGGLDLLEAARALDTNGDPQGLAFLKQVLTSDHEPLRYEAAFLIGSRDSDAVLRTLKTGLASDNPWTRIASLRAFRRLKWALPAEGRRLLADPVPHVAAAAVAAVSSGVRTPRPPSGRKNGV